MTIYVDHGKLFRDEKRVEEVAISEFKAKCLALLEQVLRTKKPIRITRFGKAVAEVVPPVPAAAQADWLGSMADTMEILGDIVSPWFRQKAWLRITRRSSPARC